MAADATCINKEIEANVRANIFPYAYKIASTVHAHEVTFFFLCLQRNIFLCATANPGRSVKQ